MGTGEEEGSEKSGQDEAVQDDDNRLGEDELIEKSKLPNETSCVSNEYGFGTGHGPLAVPCENITLCSRKNLNLAGSRSTVDKSNCSNLLRPRRSCEKR